MHVYLPYEKGKRCAPHYGASRMAVKWRDVTGGTSRGLVGCDVGWWLVGLHCSVGEAHSRWSQMCGSWYFPRFLLRGVLHVDEHGLLGGPGLAVNFLVYYVELVGIHGDGMWWNCVGVWGKGPWSVPWSCHQVFCLIPLCRCWSSWCVGIDSGRWCLSGWLWGPYPLGCLMLSLRVFVPLKCTWIPLFLHTFLNFSLSIWYVGNNNGGLSFGFVCGAVVVVGGWWVCWNVVGIG